MNHRRLRPLALGATLLAVASIARAGEAARFGHTAFTTPDGWTRAESKDWMMLTPPGVPAGKTVGIYLSTGAESSTPFRAEFDATVEALAKQFGTPQPSDVDSTTAPDGSPMLRRTLICLDANGQATVQMYAARRVGGRFEVSFLTSDDAGHDAANIKAFATFLASVRPAEPAAAVNAATPPLAAAPTPVVTPAVAPDAKPAPAAVAMPAMQPMSRRVDGWVYVSRIFNGHYACDFYWFRPDGHVYLGRPNGASTDADFAALVKSDPKNCGTYGTAGDQPATILKPGWNDARALGGGVLGNVVYFDAGARLDGRWTRTSALANSGKSGGFEATAASYWAFRKDGTFQGGSSAGVAGRNGSLGAGSEVNKGTYELVGHQVRLTYADGATRVVETAGSDDKAKPRILFVDDGDFALSNAHP